MPKSNSRKGNSSSVQAPLTRMRGEKGSEGGHVPVDRAVEYYGQRANKGGLLITEATDICLHASGYPGVPGIFSPSQIAGWKKVTDAVHAKGGFIFCQIWHTGRASGPNLLGGQAAWSSTSSPMKGTYLDGQDCAENPPRPMTVDEIHSLTAEFAAAAKRAVEAGFDGVEIHSKNNPFLTSVKYRLTFSQVQTAIFWISSCTTTSTPELTRTVAPWRTEPASLWK
jgi:2,4-dienoyl-CoA reductase-like NADH-dependent reductase (Old Yellow Enzyme family)